MTKRAIVAQLQRGVHPKTFATPLGIYVDVYIAGRYVIKQPFVVADIASVIAYIRRYRRGRLRVAPTTIVGEWWVQPRYRPLTAAQRDRWHHPANDIDLHAGNIGRDARGRYYAFDW